MRDELIPAKDVAVYWIEHVLRNAGTRHLQSSAKNMPFYQQYLIDVWLFLTITPVVVIVILIKLCITLLGKRRRINKKKDH